MIRSNTFLQKLNCLRKSNVLNHAIILLFFSLIVLQKGYAQDYLKSVSNIDTATTTANSKAWTDVTSVTIDVTDISNVLVTATINMRPSGSNTGGREGNYNIYRNSDLNDNSGIIKRQIKSINEPTVASWGIGTLVHIFDVNSLTGDQTFVIEHRNNGGSASDRNVFSSIRLNALALTTNIFQEELRNDVKRLDDPGYTTTSASFAAVTGLTTDTINLPIQGDVFVMASINSKASADAVAEYKLQSSADNGVNWVDLGTGVKRSMVNSFDDGIVTLTGLLQDQPTGNYKFRIVHRRISGSGIVETHYTNLVAFALAHANGRFESFYSEVDATGVDIIGESASAAEVTSAAMTTAANIAGVGPNLFVSSQYLVGASNLNQSIPERMRAGNQLYIDDGSSSTRSEVYYRYIPDNSNFGSGGFIGLTDPLSEKTNYTVGMEHDVVFISAQDGTLNEVLTTSNTIVQGFQTYETPPILPIELLIFSANVEDSKVRLTWTTASEKNNDYFTVERSTNCLDWTELQQLNGAGNSNSTLHYEVVDNAPYFDLSYYRLKQTDFNGGHSYSESQDVFMSTLNSEIRVFPNPTKGLITIVGSPLEIAQVRIYNLLGQDLTALTKRVLHEKSKMFIDLADLKEGFYFVITENTSNKVHKQ
jgi:hypothetical protein